MAIVRQEYNIGSNDKSLLRFETASRSLLCRDTVKWFVARSLVKVSIIYLNPKSVRRQQSALVVGEGRFTISVVHWHFRGPAKEMPNP
jgi:hypothetical protein